MKDYALAYARAGYAILPCEGKVPLLSSGCSAASTNQDVVKAWFERCPEANIGIRCGPDVLVLDTDFKNNEEGEIVKDGEADLRALKKRLGPLPEGPKAMTGSGGRHRFFQSPDVPISGRTNIGGKSIDIRIGNQYLIVEPSIHPTTGNRYLWTNPLIAVDGKTIRRLPLPKLPFTWIDWLVSVAGKSAPTKKASSCSRLASADDWIQPDRETAWKRIALALFKAGHRVFPPLMDSVSMKRNTKEKWRMIRSLRSFDLRIRILYGT